MKTYYYNIDDGEFIYPSGDRCNVVPELFYQENAAWRIALRDRKDLPVDISGVSAWGAAVDHNYCSGSVPMCRTLAEDIRADVESGAVEVAIDAATPEFLAAVNGTAMKPAFFELYGLDAAGERVLSLCFEIRARMVLDPDPTISGDVPETVATKVYAAAVASGAAASVRDDLRPQIDARPTSSGARQIASAVVDGGGYAKTSEVNETVRGAVATASGTLQAEIDERITTSGARQIASAVITSGGYAKTSEVNEAVSGAVATASGTLQTEIDAVPTSGDARQIAEEVVSSAGGQVRSTVEVLNWTSTSAYIPVLSGGTCYNFLQPVSAMRIDAAPRSFEDATILCHFEGGTNFLYPPDLGEIGEISVSSGFYRIAVNAKQLIAAQVRYTGPVGIYSDDGPGGVTSTWVLRNWTVSNAVGGDHIVYNGGAASNVSVISSPAGDGRGTLQVSGGYVEKLFVGSSGFVRATGGTISRLTVSAKGSAYIYGAEVKDLVIHNGGATPQVRVSNGGIVRGVRTSGVCEFWLYSGGRAEQLDCAISTFCHVSGALITGGNFAGTRLKIIDGGRAVGLTLAMLTSGDANNGVLSDGIMSDCLIAPGGIYIVKGGTAYATTIDSSGARFVVSGGTASAVTISSGGTLTVSSGGTALAVTSNAGAVVSSAAGAVIEYV